MKFERHNFEFKKEVVMAYLNYEGSMQAIADCYGIKSSISRKCHRKKVSLTDFGEKVID